VPAKSGALSSCRCAGNLTGLAISPARQWMMTAAANSETLLTRLMIDAPTKMRRSRGRLLFNEGVFSMDRKRPAATNDARHELFILTLRRKVRLPSEPSQLPPVMQGKVLSARARLIGPA